MNIFVVDKDPKIAAQMLCDKHVIKMILESAQMLCSAHQEAPYKRTHYNHPCSIWARTSRANYEWLIKHAYALVFEHSFRYPKSKPHKSLDVIMWCEENIDKLEFPEIGLTKFAQAMPDEYKQENVVEAYRAYYLCEKKTIASWKKYRKAPKWWSCQNRSVSSIPN